MGNVWAGFEISKCVSGIDQFLWDQTANVKNPPGFLCTILEGMNPMKIYGSRICCGLVA